MFVSGFTFCRNLVRLDYPFLESIRSLLPVVNELIVAVGDSDDGTLEAVEQLQAGDPKIRIVQTIWDSALFDNGKIFAQQTNLGLEHVSRKADWAIHLQSDELLHEGDYERFLLSLERYRTDPSIVGLMLRQLYFYGDYWHTNPYAGRRLLRVVRANGTLESIGDASGFARKVDGKYIDKSQKHLWRYADGTLFHYGYVNSPRKLQEKVRAKADLYHMGSLTNEDQKLLLEKDYQPEFMGIMKPFKGTHPAVMQERINRFPVRYQLPNRWLNPEFYAYVLRHGFKG